MKKTKLIIATSLIIVAILVVVASCKKEKTDKASEETTSEASAYLCRINEFHKLRDAVNSGLKTEGTMSVQEMRETLCLVANYDYSEHTLYCLNTVMDTLKVAMPYVDSDGNVAESDVVAAYNDFETALQKKMTSIDDDMDVPSLFSIILPKTGTKDDDINIVFTRGQETTPEPALLPSVDGPFEMCLYWGLNLGRCDEGTLPYFTDAAKELTKFFKFDYSLYDGTFYFPNIVHVYYIGTNLLQTYNSNWVYWQPPVYQAPCTQRLFWHLGVLQPDDDEPCLCADELNCEYDNINSNIVSPTGDMHYSPTEELPYFQCIVFDERIGKEPVIGRLHVACVTYAEYQFVPNQN